MVTLIISAYNEEKSIDEKLRNSLDLLYPRDLLEIVVASDGSTDGTAEIVASYAGRGVILRHFDGRIGKSACLNQAVQLASGEIVVFSDANSQYDPGAIRGMIDRFSDRTVGFVTGRTQYLKSEDGKTVDAVGLYSKIEQWTKRYEGKLSSCVGADGAIFAVRRALFSPIRADDINDLVIPLAVVRRGYRGVLEETAVCTEALAEEYREEYRRQVRIATRTIMAVVNNSDLLNPFRHGIFAFQLFSHKLAKLLVPFFLALLAFSNALLAVDSLFFTVLLVGQVAVYALALVASPAKSKSRIAKISSMIRTLLIHNGGVFMGWINFFSGRQFTTWSTARR
jgi:cellulose synthase/poly-beta-1,6-N-acetylglucosamine synthase-like glycosyltransferase